MTEKFDFATPEYIAFAAKLLQEEVSKRASEFAGVKYTISEVFTDAPAHLTKDGRLTWQMRFDNDRITWTPGKPEQADLNIEYPYQVAMGIVHLTSEEIAQQYAGMMDAAEGMPKLIMETTSKVHDLMIPYTR